MNTVSYLMPESPCVGVSFLRESLSLSGVAAQCVDCKITVLRLVTSILLLLLLLLIVFVVVVVEVVVVVAASSIVIIIIIIIVVVVV